MQTAKKLQSSPEILSLPTDLYHITPTTNIDSILRKGIDPTYARGKTRACYFVIGSLIKWALLHISARHEVSVARLSILRVKVPLLLLKATSKVGVYLSKETLTIEDILRVGDYVGEWEPTDDETH